MKARQPLIIGRTFYATLALGLSKGDDSGSPEGDADGRRSSESYAELGARVRYTAPETDAQICFRICRGATK
jgi:hypothetical protein